MDDQPVDMSNGNMAGSRRNWPIITAVIVAVIALCALFLWLLLGQPQKPSTSSDGTANKLYTMLGNAVQQQKLHVAMYRATFANKADADANKNIGSQVSSVTELDTSTGDFRSVFANDLFDRPKFDIGRCMGTGYQDTYNDNYQNDEERPNSLAEANEALKTRVFKITQQLTFIPCPYLGIIPQSTPDLAVARLSDGVFPVTLSQAQAADWVAKVKVANLFDIKDEGMVDHDGEQLRKLSFSPKSDLVNKQLYDTFYQAAEIEKVKRERPNASWQFGFITMNPLNTGGVGGYYLVDEQTNLPVYSELYGTNPDKAIDDGPAAIRNIARTKQTYTFSEQLTLTSQSPLELLPLE